MPRDYPEWDMSDETRQALHGHLEEGQRAAREAAEEEAMLIRSADPADIEAVIGQVGRDRLLEALAGTPDRGSRQWENARHNLSRWRRGVHSPDAAHRGVIKRQTAAAVRRARARHRQLPERGRKAHVRLSATFRTSDRRRPWTGVADAYLTGEDIDDFRAALAGGDDVLAAQITSDAYGLDPDFVLGLDDVSGFAITWDDPDTGLT